MFSWKLHAEKGLVLKSNSAIKKDGNHSQVFWTDSARYVVVFYFRLIIFLFVILSLVLMSCVCDIYFISVFHSVCQLMPENKNGSNISQSVAYLYQKEELWEQL